MMIPTLAAFHRLVLFGFFLPPLMRWGGIALVGWIVLRWLFDLFGLYRLVWHRALFNLALYVLLVGAVVWIGNRPW